jgi:hypothetical protein
LLTTVATIPTVLRLRRFVGSSFDELLDCFPGFERIFVVPFVLVARFNFAKNSFVINFGSFNNGIYVPSSKNKQKKSSFFF